MVPSAFFDSFITMVKPPFTYLRTSNGPIEEMRNNIVRAALRDNCSHLIMMDTDQVYHSETIPRLLSYKLPVVGCLVYRRYPPFDPIMMRGTLGKYETVTEWEPESLVEVDATGTGCIMFDMNVFRKMPSPWFRARRHEGASVGEDIGFCSDLRRLGYRIFVDTAIPAGHLSQMQITEGTWRLYRKLRGETTKVHLVEHDVVKTILA
jgi:hypothetical protein